MFSNRINSNTAIYKPNASVGSRQTKNPPKFAHVPTSSPGRFWTFLVVQLFFLKSELNTVYPPSITRTHTHTHSHAPITHSDTLTLAAFGCKRVLNYAHPDGTKLRTAKGQKSRRDFSGDGKKTAKAHSLVGSSFFLCVWLNFTNTPKCIAVGVKFSRHFRKNGVLAVIATFMGLRDRGQEECN